MWSWLSRLLIAVWFMGILAGVVLNQNGRVDAQGTNLLHFPLIYDGYDLTVRDYVGLVRTGEQGAYNFYTVRGDNSAWTPLALNQQLPLIQNFASWSLDGKYFLSRTNQEVAIIPLATRKARVILEGVQIYGASWSADGGKVAFFGGSALYIWDIVGESLTTIPSAAVTNSRLQPPVWSPNQQYLAWVRNDSQAWFWSGGETSPRLVYDGLWTTNLFWSPDSTQLLMNGEMAEESAIYAATPDGQEATLFLSGYQTHGWVDGGNRLLVSRAGDLYLAQADGSEPVLFSVEGDFAGAAKVSPTGDYVLYGRTYEPYGTYLQATDSLTGTVVNNCRGISYEWRADGTQFSCNSHLTYGFYGTVLGDTTTTPPQSRDLLNYMNAEFISGSQEYIGMDHVIPGYPTTHVASFLYRWDTEDFKQIRYPQDDIYPVVEWRYMP